MQKHRLYAFVNEGYMNAKQWGIQTAHVVSTLMAQGMRSPKTIGPAMLEWAEGSPTIIMCGLHNVEMLLDHEEALGRLAKKMKLPFASFREDQSSLGGVITCVGILIPESFATLRLSQVDDQLTFGAPPSGDVDYSGVKGGLPVTARSHPALHALLSVVKSARLAQ